MRKGLWSPDEDEKLRTCIAQHRSGSWSDIARKAGLQRCGKSCRRRWMNHLRPDLKREKFTPEELKLVAKLHQTLGNKWSEIATYLVGRTDNDVKNLWNTQIKKQSRIIHPETPLQKKGNNVEGFPFSMDPSIDHMGQLSFQKAQLSVTTSSSTSTPLIASSWGCSSINASNITSQLEPQDNLEEKHVVMDRLYNPFLTPTSYESNHAQMSELFQHSKIAERLGCSLDDCPLIDNTNICATPMGYTTQNISNGGIHCNYYVPMNLSSMLLETIGKKDQQLDNYVSSSYEASPEGARSSNESSTSTIMVGDDNCSVSKPYIFELHHKLQFQQNDNIDYHGQDQKDDDDANCLSRGESWSSSSCEQWALETLIGTCEKAPWY